MHYKKLIFLFTFIGFIFVSQSWLFQKNQQYNFQSLEYYHDIKDIFVSAEKGTLFLFDVDDTLITVTDAIRFAPPLFKVLAFLKHPLSTFKYYQLTSAIVQQSNFFVFDPHIVRYIQTLRQKDYNVIGLTLMRSGSYGSINSMPEWRSTMLNDFGINLDDQFPDCSFKNLSKKHGSYPCLYKGILCTNFTDKGATLGAFLDRYNLQPPRIIFFDDSVKMLNSVAKECAKRDIPFSGYQCIGAQKLFKTWNYQRAFYQVDYFIKHHVWLSDEEADTQRKVII
ncbi:TPA: hypothetical protein DIC20_01910 [Candidatus Dependentiae bacterium]|nr:MAG: hypothetical protein US03_C0013G0021 [candidate division TM6 bacterium GW2011_GWF2_36_131]KKQ02564.1 MAG: hypothetical protein US13_C0014G0021 [candidate division TM6 bacterium GW2011_GWE2_36_25]KKQ19319.1 MAG: hypothetical protein US32_C0011G0021 [candidate division TM6 bacterium GW2011_GWA2_36_9]HBR70910.1 hypothetical protein [Candidatus Dependentiae bacterium]HCU00442.1 hypothetical protein [Candidatus Dependentiae bacterium]